MINHPQREQINMLQKKINETKYFQFPKLSQYPEINHGIFTRHGGVSEGKYKSLNIGNNVGDSSDKVSDNKKIILKIIGGKTLVTLKQIHSSHVTDYGNDKTSDEPVEADAVITDIKGATLLIQTADCQAILLYDPIKKVIANIHSGWKGSINNIIGNTVNLMVANYNSNPSDISAGIGPSLGQCCAEFTNYELEIPEKFWQYKNENNHFNFWALSHDQLFEAGILKDNIEISKFCTKCNQDLFFSYRRDKVTGRLANMISII